MALPVKSEVSTLDYIDWSLPTVYAEAKEFSGGDSQNLDFIDWSLPLAVSPDAGSPLAGGVYINVSGTWKLADEVHVNVSGTWKRVTDDLLNVNVGGTWKS
tara:strand:+ start:3089 stop:3391 length:303 start_codon:yes stop_codon:yes gene_type:complete